MGLWFIPVCFFRAVPRGTCDTGEVCDACGGLLWTGGSVVILPAAGKALPAARVCLPCGSPPVTWDGFALASGVALPGDELGG